MSAFEQLLRDGVAHHRAGRLAEAAAIYARILAAEPRHADALHLSGLIAYKQGRFDDAIALVHRAIDQAPANAVFHGNLGNIQKDAGRRDDAIASHRNALALDPAHVSARNNLGVLLREAGDVVCAIEEFRRVVAQRTDHFRAHYNLGNALIETGDTAGAEASLRRAIALQPKFADAIGDLGLLLQSSGRRAEAIEFFRRRTAVEPEMGAGHADLALAFHQDGQFGAAIASYERALALAPDALEVTCNFCALLQKVCDWERLAQHVLRVMQALREGRPGVPIGLTTSLPGVTPKMQLDAARANAAALAGKPAMSGRRPIDGSRRLRVGYLSADFREHATTWLTAELLELHDRAGHEILLFSYGPDDGSSARARVREAADQFIDVAMLTDSDAARRIADSNLDILVDLNGSTDNGRMGILAWRPARIQVNWLGFPGTLGADWYDYLVADRFVIPPGAEANYAETVVRLPDCYQSNDRKRPQPTMFPSREACGFPPKGVVLGCFNQSYKITPEIFAVWMRVLVAVPASVLWLYYDNPQAVASLRARAKQAGVAPKRLVFAAPAKHADHLARYGVADLAVDTFPCTSHTTASDALWMGCPLVTITGDTFAARVATSLLCNVGAPDLAARSFADYEALIVAIAGDVGRCTALRRRIEAGRDSAPLFDTPRFARNLERLYAAMAKAPARAGAG